MARPVDRVWLVSPGRGAIPPAGLFGLFWHERSRLRSRVQMPKPTTVEQERWLLPFGLQSYRTVSFRTEVGASLGSSHTEPEQVLGALETGWPGPGYWKQVLGTGFQPCF